MRWAEDRPARQLRLFPSDSPLDYVRLAKTDRYPNSCMARRTVTPQILLITTISASLIRSDWRTLGNPVRHNLPLMLGLLVSFACTAWFLGSRARCADSRDQGVAHRLCGSVYFDSDSFESRLGHIAVANSRFSDREPWLTRLA